jgi:hypothetical protein
MVDLLLKNWKPKSKWVYPAIPEDPKQLHESVTRTAFVRSMTNNTEVYLTPLLVLAITQL